ncbi:FtsK/SpoIIIE domain-containing protein [Solirubrobacter soli]|uniref:FtsK/SpoIIIE domain-containing protein n=1 Tax=Solirubrobacter soli TaxID=363832 RepID=UPI0012FCDD2B|nr:FtsK/SpoIIIE domain-containing protein [Solirubrobacter soli]
MERALRHAPLLVALAVWFVAVAVLGSVLGTVAAYGGGWWLARDAMRGLHRRYGPAVLVAAVALIVWEFAVNALGLWLGTAGTLATVALTVWANWPWFRAQWRVLRAWRDWRRACAACGLSRPDRPAPRLRRFANSRVGIELTVDCGHGWTASDVERAAPGLASWYRAREVRVSQDTADAGRCTVLVVARDPLARMAGTPWPNLDAIGLSMWDPIPLALDANGQTRRIRLPDSHLLIGGEPGGGKSVAMSMIVATAALDTTCTVFALDGKQVDLVPWENSCAAFAGANMEDALTVLRDAEVWMDSAYAALRAAGKRKVTEGDPLGVLVVDELAYYANSGKTSKEFNGKLRDLVARGRAAGLIVVAATQKPSTDTIPSSIRDLFPARWALRCSTPEASDTVLGKGRAAAGTDASRIAREARGTGYVLDEGSAPVLCRSYFISDDQLEALAGRAANQRSAGPPTHSLPGAVGVVAPGAVPGGGEVGMGSGEHARSASAVGEPFPALSPSPAVVVPGPGGPEPGVSGGGKEPVAARAHGAGGQWGPLIAVELAERPGSNAEIARRLGCDRTTVAYHRRRLATSDLS